MGNCLLFSRKNRVGYDDYEKDLDYDEDNNISESEYYTERVTHIVADIHERILHKVFLSRKPKITTRAGQARSS